MKKIVLFIPDISRSGGTERATINLANMMIDSFEVEIISFHNREDVISTFYEINNKVILSSFKLVSKSSIVNLFKNFYCLRKYFTNNNADYVIGTWYGVSILLPFFKKESMKVIACEHTDFVTIPNFVKKLFSISYPKLDSLITLSEIAKKKLLRFNNNIIVIPNSLPFEPISVSKHDNCRILMLGRLTKVKGYERIIPLAKYLAKNHPEWRIDIYGDGELRDELNYEFMKHKLNNVKINSPKKGIEELYLNSSIYLSTSYNEAMPMVFLEAMSCGVPVVSYINEGAINLIKNNQDGSLVNEFEDLIEKISFLINNKEIRIKMGEKGKEKSMNFTTNRIKDKWIQLFNSL